MATIPRKLSEQELDWLMGGGMKEMSAAARLRYLEQRMEQAKLLLSLVPRLSDIPPSTDVQERDILAKKLQDAFGPWWITEDRIRAFLAEGGE